MDISSGDLKSSNLNGADQVNVLSTNKTGSNNGIHVYDSKVYCSNDIRILMVTILPVISTKVIHSNAVKIFSVFYFNETRKFIL